MEHGLAVQQALIRTVITGLASTDEAFTFVTHDRGALWIALREPDPAPVLEGSVVPHHRW